MASSIKANADGTTSVLNGSGQEVLKIPSTAGADVNVATLGDMLGVGQTWQAAELTNTGAKFTDGTAKFRASGVNYTNSTGKPIEVAIYIAASNSTHTLTINGIVVNTIVRNASYNSTIIGIVPAGAQYLFTGVTPTSWSELR